jgi:ribosome-binding factor A
VGELIRRTSSEVLSRGDVHDLELNRLSAILGKVGTFSDLKVATACFLTLCGAGKLLP